MHWEILERRTLFQRFFRVEEYRIRHERFDGAEQEVVREIFERGDAVVVLPYDPERDRVVMIEQFRPGAVRWPEGPWLLEFVAGMVGEGESPEAVARREAREEAGLELLELLPVCRYLVSPGGTTERIDLFCGRVDSGRAGGLHGLDEEHEDIKVHVLARSEALALLESGRAGNASTLIGLQWLALNGERLRARWSTAAG
ncbi:MAG: adenosine diphosphate sugar pyrophosphatase [Gammaproteobacteria bacterium]|nr:MAG: adenosine diphosphate sugar pyrophosphatase [Gammaproteobacteria bacterium]